ncbi:MAG: biotin--[acetyl-CoA-carboxylase] ligase [Acidobacteriota bacterium]|jgi:BirA family biotin operon repressor/biotin-[acetyl-CoA-carboxylase] ligase|nr:biotin--[acetyl-CoA-carboxylase] ligase [Acidobacteriota bacterium]NLT33949.1 biotin--[acetyl-CoA-carboxylase] ligase [Acidobacteriota bacterium]
MNAIKLPSILTDLGHVGEAGLPLGAGAWFERELELCREWGFQLETIGGRVRLAPDPDALVPYWIQRETPALAWEWLRIHGFLSVDSTNREALDLARGGAPGGSLVCAEQQSAGKGRMGRSWFSPRGTGIYASLVVRPTREQQRWPLLAHVAAVSLYDAISACVVGMAARRLDIDLKWPNDVLLGGRKCAGILLESLSSGEGAPAVVVGVGINVHPGSVPAELEGEAVSVAEMAGRTVPRRLLLVTFLYHFQKGYREFEAGDDAGILEGWKTRSSMWDGVPVWILEGAVRRAAVTCGLDETGALLVRTEAGALETVFAGDIRVRRRDGS